MIVTEFDSPDEAIVVAKPVLACVFQKAPCDALGGKKCLIEGALE